MIATFGVAPRPRGFQRRFAFLLLVTVLNLTLCAPLRADSQSAAIQQPSEAGLREFTQSLQGITPTALAANAEEQTEGNAVPGLRAGYWPTRSWLRAANRQTLRETWHAPGPREFQANRPSQSAAQVTSRPGARRASAGDNPASDNAASDNAVEWGALLRHSMFFLGVQHGFRLATEEGTREGLKGPFFRDWYWSLSALHGWSDGDPFYVNYIGHPMQGGVSGFIWRQNDPAYRAIEFGNHADYWRSLMRSMAFSFVYSAQFEIGPLSEATIGAIQSRHPQQGFVDHVVTPTIGTLWVMGEDVLDRYVIRGVEGRTENVFLRMMARSWLNPTRSFANMMRFKVPWYRDSRPGIWKYTMAEERERRNALRADDQRRRETPEPAGATTWDAVAPFDFTFSADYSRHPAGAVGLNCIGGGGTAVWNRGPTHSWVAEVSGCKIFTDDDEYSGDILTYRVGSRWTRRSGRWMPYGQVLVGGKRATVEWIPEDRREFVREMERLPASERPPRSEFVDIEQANGFALSLGGGIDYGLSRAAMLRLLNFDYTRAWVPGDSFASYPNSIRFSMGIILRVGTW